MALRTGARLGAEVAFVDRSWVARASDERSGDAAGRGVPDDGASVEDAPGGAGDDPEGAGDDAFARTLQSERNLAHSRTIAAVAERLGCRDHDEVWDHLFEARTSERLADWRELFDDVFAWAGLARLDYEEEVLDADGSLAREALMSARVAEHRARVEGPVVVVTGAFHTLALVEALTGAPEERPS